MIQRKGIPVKFLKIEAALDKVTDIREAYAAIERFNLSNVEEAALISKWKIQQSIYRCHGIEA